MFGQEAFETVNLAFLILTITMLGAIVPMLITAFTTEGKTYRPISERDVYVAFVIDIFLYVPFVWLLYNTTSLSRVIVICIISQAFVIIYRRIIYNESEGDFKEIGRVWFYGLTGWSMFCSIIGILVWNYCETL